MSCLLRNKKTHYNILKSTLNEWSQEFRDLHVLTEDGGKIYTSFRLLLLHSPMLRELYKELQPYSGISVISAPVTFDAMDKFMHLMTDGTVETSDLDSINVVANSLGINLGSVDVGLDNNGSEEQLTLDSMIPQFENVADTMPVNMTTTTSRNFENSATQFKEDVVECKKENNYEMETSVSLSEYSCNICGKNYSRPEYLRRHQVCHTSEDGKPFQCVKCDRRFSRKDKLADHVKKNHDNYTDSNHAPADIHSWNFAFNQFNGIISSYTPQGFPANMQTSTNESTNEPSFPCNECGNVYQSAEAMRRHLVTHSAPDGKPFACFACEKRYSRKDKLAHHLRTIHDEQLPPKSNADIGDRFSCDHCDSNFARKDGLNRHIRNAHADLLSYWGISNAD